MKISISIFVFLLCTRAVAFGQDANPTIQKGNDQYRAQQYQQAEKSYSDAMEQDKMNMTARFNHANALYRQSKQEQSLKALDDLAFKAEDNAMKSKAYYNQGVIYSAQKRLEESIDSYKNALRRNPDDKEARENLQKALQELKKKTPQQKKDDKKQQQKPKPQAQKMSQKEAEQRLKLLEQKEKDVQQRMQQEKSKNGGGQSKDW